MNRSHAHALEPGMHTHNGCRHSDQNDRPCVTQLVCMKYIIPRCSLITLPTDCSWHIKKQQEHTSIIFYFAFEIFSSFNTACLSFGEKNVVVQYHSLQSSPEGEEQHIIASSSLPLTLPRLKPFQL